VHNPVPVRVRQRPRHVAEDAHRLIHGQLALPPEPRAERLALDEGHRVVEQPVSLARAEQRDDVRVPEAGGELDLTPESLSAGGARQLWREDLHYDLSSERGLLGREDARHPATAEFPLDAVCTAEGGLEPRLKVHHEAANIRAARSRREPEW
jgi:hypothetical protein